jgi:capsid protein
MTNEQPDVVGVDDVSVSNAAVQQYKQPEINLAYNQILELDHGKTLQALNMQFPRQGFSETVSQYLKAICSGLFVSYATLSADPSAGNSANVRFSSVVEREHFAQLQRWIIKSFHMKVYTKWIENALLYGAVVLPSINSDDYLDVNFRSNRQSTIDPSKDMKAYIDGIANGLYTRSDICAQMGSDFFENVKQLAVEEEYIAKYGVTIATNVDVPIVPITPEEEAVALIGV